MAAVDIEEPDRVGTLVGGKYRIAALIAEGGMGRVYRARNELLGRDVALKVMLARHAASPQLVNRFVREARTANLVRHPHVVDVLDVGLDEAGVPYIVQELLHGVELSVHLWRAGGRLPVEAVLPLMTPVIDAVAYAHARGVVHRDLKPDNVFLVREGEGWIPKVLDFGISKCASAEPNGRDSFAGVAIGTPAYMPPEQARGAGDADARSDVWSLGVVLYELLSGKLPFRGRNDDEVLANVCRGRMVPLAESLPGAAMELCAVVERCLRAEPSERYPSAAELLRDVQHLMAGRRIEPTRRVALYRPIAVPDAVAPVPSSTAAERSSGPALEWSAQSDPGNETLRAAAVPARRPSRRPLWRTVALGAVAVAVGAGLAIMANASHGSRQVAPVVRAIARESVAEPVAALPAPVAPARLRPATASRPVVRAPVSTAAAPVVVGRSIESTASPAQARRRHHHRRHPAG